MPIPVAFNATLIGLLLFAWRFRGDPHWREWGSYTLITALAMMGCLAAFGIVARHGGPAGLFEKLAVAVRTTWSIAFVSRLWLGKIATVTEKAIS